MFWIFVISYLIYGSEFLLYYTVIGNMNQDFFLHYQIIEKKPADIVFNGTTLNRLTQPLRNQVIKFQQTSDI